MLFIKILKNTIQIKNEKRWLCLVLCLAIKDKKLNPIVPEVFIIGRKINISLIFIVQSYFAIPKYIGLIFTHYFIMKIPNKQGL